MNTLMAKMVGVAYSGVVALGVAACQAQKTIPMASEVRQKIRENSKKR